MAALAITAQAAAADDIVIDLRALQGTEAPYAIPMDKQGTITAVENRSTGYSWAVKNTCGARFKLEDDAYGYEDLHDGVQNMSFGRQGRRTFTFSTPGADSNAIQGEPCELTFQYKRPWLPEADRPEDTKVVTVVVGEKNVEADIPYIDEDKE